MVFRSVNRGAGEAGAGYGMVTRLREASAGAREAEAASGARTLTRARLSPGNNLPADKYTQAALQSLCLCVE